MRTHAQRANELVLRTPAVEEVGKVRRHEGAVHLREQAQPDQRLRRCRHPQKDPVTEKVVVVARLLWPRLFQ